MAGAWVKAVDPDGEAMQEGFVPAYLGRRTLAWMIDFGLIVVAVVVTELALGRRTCAMRWDVTATGATMASYSCQIGTMTSNELFGALYSGLYSVILWRLGGATLGQRLYRMRVCAIEGPRALPILRCVLRWAALYGWLVPALVAANARLATVAEIVLALYLLSMMRTAVTDRSLSRGWHDRLAGSVVVQHGHFWASRYSRHGAGGAGYLEAAQE